MDGESIDGLCNVSAAAGIELPIVLGAVPAFQKCVNSNP
jgi:hypothetical protein